MAKKTEMPKRYTPEVRSQVLADKAAGATLAQLTEKYGVSSAIVYKWLAHQAPKPSSTAPSVPELLEENRKLKEIIKTLLAL